MDQAATILAGLGGAENLLELEPCITRLRGVVRDGSRVDASMLKAAGAHAVTQVSNVVQIVVGPTADTLCMDIEDLF